MKKWWIIGAFLLAGCSQSKQSDSAQTELTISAAASLQNALEEIQSDFENDNPDIRIQFNIGSSGSLSQQISQGAPVDLFFSAAEEPFDRLAEEGLVSSEVDLLGNSLVLITPDEQGVNVLEDIPETERISIGTPESVPAGQYAKEALEAVGLWEMVEEKVVYAKDVRQVLTYVETGNVDAGIVYQTDAMSSEDVTVVQELDAGLHGPIVYPLGIVKESEAAELFYNYLKSEEALAVFEKYGFKGLTP
ncbi:molybdate ABC transporter substrate-binding protein [Jeotgalibacillus sp. R-1-5s-1]|uniref:molybdate ABC transporter substrate-binding protein n=1 Tax=Jeotgalibacillus sp. R-1-5s-1 TaxID=2555897 RepID=UPI00106928EC|nr:molybdate ABC transporter substrate-binding protein [Jeotgalibacillus sp. R-1-5s-1]TFE00173.1 molybdate ABC transporter substrate-binding protein [Jeotgalibacillus sp. R-1-5s-1]